MKDTSRIEHTSKVTGVLLILAWIAWVAVLLQFYLSVNFATHNGKSIGDGIIAFLGYFTVLTNLLVAVSVTFSLIGPASMPGRWFLRPDMVAGIATSIALVGLAYHFLLRNAWNPQGMQLLADLLLHYVVPALYVLYWWLSSSGVELRWTGPIFWSIYPAIYLAYVLIRGRIIGSYPYPFIDAAALGYGRTMLNACGLLLVFIALGLALVVSTRVRRRRPVRTIDAA